MCKNFSQIGDSEEEIFEGHFQYVVFFFRRCSRSFPSCRASEALEGDREPYVHMRALQTTGEILKEQRVDLCLLFFPSSLSRRSHCALPNNERKTIRATLYIDVTTPI